MRPLQARLIDCENRKEFDRYVLDAPAPSLVQFSSTECSKSIVSPLLAPY